MPDKKMQDAFNAAINFTLDYFDSSKNGRDARDAIQFLRDWREGAWDNWPEFKGPFPN